MKLLLSWLCIQKYNVQTMCPCQILRQNRFLQMKRSLRRISKQCRFL